MSELEETIWRRVDKALEAVEKAADKQDKIKTWYKNAVVTLCLTITLGVFGAGALGYKVGLMQKELKDKASIESLKLLKDSNETLTQALVSLIDNKDHQKVASDFAERYKILNDNIFVYTTTRGGNSNNHEN